jgi:hypothetical protein
LASYIPRTIAPSKTDKDFIKTTHGGKNLCIEIENGSCLPNCVGYCWGRWLEILGKIHNLSRCNAEDWYNNITDGYKRGQTPKVGAVICWRKGSLWDESDGAGHVAIVEKVKANGDIVTSESAYGGERFRIRTYTKRSGYFLAYGYAFQGFIYPPINFGYEKKKYNPGVYVVASPVLVVRSGAGSVYKKINFSQLTSNAQSQVKKLCGSEYNGYVKGVEVTVTKVRGRWGKTPSGWICLDHCRKI